MQRWCTFKILSDLKSGAQHNICFTDPDRTYAALVAHSSLFCHSHAPVLIQSNTQVIELTKLPASQSHYLIFNPRLLPSANFLLHSLDYFSLSVKAENNKHNKPISVRSLFVTPPQRVKDSPVGEDADQPVLHGDVMEEGLLGVNNKRVWDPEELDQPPIKAQALVALKHQALISPSLAEEYGGRVVLQEWDPHRSLAELFFLIK